MSRANKDGAGRLLSEVDRVEDGTRGCCMRGCIASSREGVAGSRGKFMFGKFLCLFGENKSVLPFFSTLIRA